MQTAYSLLGIAAILAVAVLLSSDRRAIRPRVVLPAFALQAGLAALVLYFPPGNRALQAVSSGVSRLLAFAQEGTNFLFGPLASDRLGQSFALMALPNIVFFAALIAILYHLGVMPAVIRWIGGGLRKITGISKIESLCAAANIFVGQSESPLVIRPYIAGLAPSQLFCVMTVGLAGVAGTILAAYASLGVRIDYLVAAAFMSAPGGILMAKLFMPDPPGFSEHQPPEDAIVLDPGEDPPANLIMAAAQGAQTGLRLAVAVGAMVLAFVALIALANGLIGWAAGLLGAGEVTLQSLLGLLFAPVFWLLGDQSWNGAQAAGGLFGTKLALNEVVAFMSLETAPLSPRMAAVVTFSLCGFANFASIAIQLAVTGGLAPGQRPVIARLGLRALLAASLSNLMSGALAGLFVGL
ncbi:MAG TPA: nucleoside transporter C-terminal domain-containing protein [Novosphingobium sp.]|nr:nucleoside transporter C-terminal domain-containing protein [Novosphingobium sp.]